VMDTCGKGRCKIGMRVCALISCFLVIPGVYALLLIIEFHRFGLERFKIRFMGESYNMTDFHQPTPAPRADPKTGIVPTPAPITRRGMLWEFILDNPLTWIMPAISVGMGIFANLFPIAPNLILMPLFQVHPRFSVFFLPFFLNCVF